MCINFVEALWYTWPNNSLEDVVLLVRLTIRQIRESQHMFWSCKQQKCDGKVRSYLVYKAG